MPTLLFPSRFAALARLLVASSGREALRRALPFYLALAIAAFVLFAGNGLDASTITAAAERSLSLRICLMMSWIIAGAPAARALLHDPRTQFLKALPVPAAHIAGVLGALLFLAEWPWVLLWARGSGPWVAVAAALTATSAHALALARPRRRREWVTLIAITCVWSLGPAPLSAALGALIVGPAVVEAWRSSADDAGGVTLPWARLPSTLALACAYLVTTRRAHPQLLSRALLLVLLGAGFCVFVARNNGLSDREPLATLAEASWAPLALLPAVALAGRMLATEAHARWMLDTSALSSGGRIAALALALSACNIALAVVYGGALTWGLGLGVIASLGLMVELSVLGAALGVVVESVARSVIRGDGRDGARLIVSVLVLGGVAVSTLVLARTLALVAWPLVALARLALAERTWRLRGSPSGPGGATTMKPMVLQLTNVRKTLGGRRLLDATRLTLEAGCVAVVQGANGVGKSTLLRVVSGLVPVDAGELQLGDTTLAQDPIGYKAQLGYAPDSTDAFPELRAGEYLALVQSLKGARGQRAAVPPGWLERLGVHAFLRSPIATLSFGQRKRLCTVAALAGDPWLLLLDEPTNGLDAEGIAAIAQLIATRAAARQATLCTSNDAAFAAREGRRRYLLSDGNLQPWDGVR